MVISPAMRNTYVCSTVSVSIKFQLITRHMLLYETRFTPVQLGLIAIELVSTLNAGYHKGSEGPAAAMWHFDLMCPRLNGTIVSKM